MIAVKLPQLIAPGPNWWWVYTGLGHGMVPSGNKPSPESMLTKLDILHQWQMASPGVTRLNVQGSFWVWA